MAKKNPHVGSSFESWLDQEGIRDEIAPRCGGKNLASNIRIPLPPGPNYSANTQLAEDIRKNFQTYAAELGSVVYAWNNLHEALGELFWCVTGATNGIIPLACWNAIDSDRTQRKMLKSAVEARAGSATEPFHNPKAQMEIKWLLAEAEKLANRRNDATHSPYRFIISPSPMTMEADHFKGHPRAKNLKDKDLLAEFIWYRKTADTLTLFARHLIMSVWNPNAPWPKRPILPTLGQKGKGR